MEPEKYNNNNADKLEENEYVSFGSAVYMVTSVYGNHASLMNVMDHSDRPEAVPLSSLSRAGYGSGSEMREKEIAERNIQAADGPVFEKQLLNTPLDVQKLVAVLTRDIIENRKKKNTNKLPESFRLESTLVVDAEGELFNIVAFDADGLDLMNLKTGDTFPYDWETFKELFSPYKGEKDMKN
jgi:hypothetical protein